MAELFLRFFPWNSLPNPRYSDGRAPVGSISRSLTRPVAFSRNKTAQPAESDVQVRELSAGICRAREKGKKKSREKFLLPFVILGEPD